MTQYGPVPDPAPFENLRPLDVDDLYEAPASDADYPSSVFPGKPYLAGTTGNLALNTLGDDTELLDIFDEFADVVSGELRSLGLERYMDANPETDF